MSELKVISQADIEALDQRFRVNLINSLQGFKPVNLIGTQSKNGQTNLAVFSSVFHVGADPALIGMVSRPDNGDRHTLSNIKETGCYTINHVNQSIYKQAHQTSARYLPEECEFAATGLTQQYCEGFYAPFVKESRLQIAVQLKDIIKVPLNDTQIIIGQILFVRLEEGIMQADGHLDLGDIDSVVVGGLDAYYKAEKLERLPYAKKDKRVSA